MQRRRGAVAKGGNQQQQQEVDTARKISKKPSEDRLEDKKKIGVFRKIGLMLNHDKEQGSTLKKKAAPKKKATDRKPPAPAGQVRKANWNPDKTVHFNITKAHSSIPLKGDPLTDIQKKVFQKFAADCVKKSPPELSAEYHTQVKTWPGAPVERKIFDANPTKNRYKDVVCNDVTRVILNDGGVENDYIHANYVNGLTVPFILTQGPTPATIADFWRMIVHTRTSYIVMLCELVEDGRAKCGAYFPDRPGVTVTFGCWSVTCVSDDDRDQNIHKRTLSVRWSRDEPPHVLKHLHTRSWPDKSVPNSTLSLLRMLFLVRTASGPVTVHCSAGIGRTGTFVAVEACLQVLTDGKELDLVAVVKQLRNSRIGSVQVDVQYMTLVQILINYGKDNGYWEDGDLDDRIELLTWNIQQFIQSRGRDNVLLVTPSTTNVSTCVPPVTPAVTVPPVAPAPAHPAPAPAHHPAAPPQQHHQRASPAPQTPPLPSPSPNAPNAPSAPAPPAPPPPVGSQKAVKPAQVAAQKPKVHHHPAPAHAPSPAAPSAPGAPGAPGGANTAGALVSRDSSEDGEDVDKDELLKIESTQKEDDEPPIPPQLAPPPTPPVAPVAPSAPNAPTAPNGDVVVTEDVKKEAVVTEATPPAGKEEKPAKGAPPKKAASQYYMS